MLSRYHGFTKVEDLLFRTVSEGLVFVRHLLGDITGQSFGTLALSKHSRNTMFSSALAF